MEEKNNNWKDIQTQLDELNRQYQNRSFWRKLKDWWLYPKGHRQIAMDENRLTLDQYFLLKIYQQQIHDSARTHQLVMVTWLLVIIGFITIIITLII